MQKLDLQDVLDKFQNGEQRYERDGYFREAVAGLVAGVGVHAILDRVLKEHTILMRLHGEELNKNRVAVAECAKLTDKVQSYKDALQHHVK